MHNVTRLLPVLAVVACTDRQPDPEATCAWSPVDGDARAHAETLSEPTGFTGPDALGKPGDILLANGRAAFVLQALDDVRTYIHYGGTPIDAVAMDGCATAGDEQFGELALLPGRLNLTAFTESSLRMFRGDTVEVVSDGSDGGDAIVRVTGVDAPFWLVDFTLSRTAVEGGGARPLSPPLGMTMDVEYVLAPDAAALELRITLRNTTDAPNQVLVGAAAWPSDLTPALVPSQGGLSFGGFGLQTDVPWFVASSGRGAWAYAFETTQMARTNVSGVEALLDLTQVIGDPLVLGPAGTLGESRTVRAFLSVGATDEASAVEALLEVLPFQAGQPAESKPLAGVVVAAESGEPLVDARVELQVDAGDLGWITLDRLRTDDTGRFAAKVPYVPGDARGRRLLVLVDGRPTPDPVPLDDEADVGTLEVAPGGALAVTVTDGDDAAMPARLTVYDGDGRRVLVRWLPPETTTVPLAPGTWDVTLERGFRHALFEEEVVITAEGTVPLNVSLPRLVDTSGWLSVDTHVHAGPSPDSSILLEDRFASAAAAGLDVILHTDHEILVDSPAALAASRWAGWTRSVVGEEMTATTPEHMTMVDAPIGPEFGPRGSPIAWYGLDAGELYDAMRERGAGAVILNHPLYGCSWLCLIGWDTLANAPTLTDPTALGLDADKELWDWEFDGVELINGNKSPFREDKGRRLFDIWQNWILDGHRITAVASSDVHDFDTPGTPRTYFPAASDDLAAFDAAELDAAIVQGRTSLSHGAYAELSIGSASLGDLATATDGEVTARVRVQAIPEIDITRVVVFVNCDAVAVLDATDPDGVLKLDEEVVLDVGDDIDAEVLVAAWGDAPFPRGFENTAADVPRALTSPIFVDTDGDGTWTPPGTKLCDYDEAIAPPEAETR